MTIFEQGERVMAATAAYEMSSTASAVVRMVPFAEAEGIVQLRQAFNRPADMSQITPFEKAGQIVRRAVWLLNISLHRSGESAFHGFIGQLELLVESVRLTDGSRAAGLVSTAIEHLRVIDALDADPLGEAVLAAIAEQNTSAPLVVVPSIQGGESADRWGKSVGIEPTIVLRSQVSSTVWAAHMIVIGAVRWYPDAMLNAPRSELLEYVQYDWSGQPKVVGGILPVSSEGVGRPLTVLGDVRTEPLINPDDLPPSPNWSAIVSGVNTGGSSGNEAEVRVRPVLLSGDHGVLIREEEGAEILCAIPADDGIEVARVAVDLLESGMYLLFRTSGSDSDLIRELADSRFGAAALRDQLEIWKRALRIRILERGVKRVRRELRAKGARTANVTYWASSDTIRPRSHHDFRILLEYLELGDEGPILMEAADEIFGAHIEAGHYVRRLLEKRLGESEFEMSGGVVRIELPHGDGGELTVLRVARIADEQFTASESAVGHPFPLKEAAWLA